MDCSDGMMGLRRFLARKGAPAVAPPLEPTAQSFPATAVFAGVVLLIVAELLYVIASYRSWRHAFASRKPRMDRSSPSHLKRPNVRIDSHKNLAPALASYRSSVKNLIELAPRSPRASMFKVQASMSPSEARHSIAALHAQRRQSSVDAGAAARSSGVSDEAAAPSSDVSDEESERTVHAHAMAALREKVASEPHLPVPGAAARPDEAGLASVDGKEEAAAPLLEMDHVRINFGQYLWGAHFVAIPSMLLLLTGLAQLLLLLSLKRAGLLRAPSAERLESMACDLILESSLAIQLRARRRDERGDEIGIFVWSPFPIMLDTAAGEVRPAGRAILPPLVLTPCTHPFLPSLAGAAGGARRRPLLGGRQPDEADDREGDAQRRAAAAGRPRRPPQPRRLRRPAPEGARVRQLGRRPGRPRLPPVPAAHERGHDALQPLWLRERAVDHGAHAAQPGRRPRAAPRL